MKRHQPSHPLLKATLLLTSALAVLTGAAIAPALPLIQEHFAYQPDVGFWVRLILTIPALFIAGTSPFAGYLVDRAGRKRVLIISTLLYGIAGLFGYLAPSLTALLISRALLGIAVAGVMTSVTTLIADYYTGVDRAQFMGLQAGFMGLAASLVLIIGGAAGEIGWRVPFLIYLLAFVLLPLVLLFLYEPELVQRCVEKPNAASDSATCIAESMRPTGGLVPGEPVSSPFPFRLVLFAYSAMLVTEIIFYLLPVQLPFYLRSLTGATPTQTGMALSAVTFFYALASVFYGRAAARWDRISIMLMAFSLICAGYLGLSLATGWWMIVPGLLVGGVGLGLMIPNLIVWVANESPPDLRGRLLGGINTALFLGQFLSPLISQPVIRVLGMSGLFLSATILTALIIMAAFITRRELRAIAS
jgi:MFS family permease